MMSVQKDNSYRLEHCPGQQGPLHEVRGVPSVVNASTSKTMQEARGVPLVVDARTSKTQPEDTGFVMYQHHERSQIPAGVHPAHFWS